MADLRQSDKLILEKQFSMGSGYVLSLSNNRFQQFIANSIKLDIYDSKYAKYGDSKANRLRAFWDIEGNVTVGKLILELLDFWRTEKLVNNTKIEESENELYNKCLSIGNKLLGKETNNQTSDSIDDFLSREYSDVSIKKLNIDSVVIEILEKRISEISKNIKGGASLSAVIMCGSVLEGMLLGIASSKMREFNTSSCGPKNKDTGKVMPFHEWTLSNFIDVAHNIGLLGLDVKKYSHSLRDFRNYIYPYQQMSSGFDPDIDTAKISWQVLKAAISDLSKN
ncbi:MAG: hypothetical protein QM737_18840 [Ferruginibacter sp.]